MAVNCNDLGAHGSAFSLSLSMRMEPAIFGGGLVSGEGQINAVAPEARVLD